MEKSEVRPLYRCCCCRYSGSRDSEPLFLAVYKNDLDSLKSLLECGKSVNGKSVRGNTLLNYVIEHKRLAIFNYLLSLDEIDVDCVDTSGRSPLLYATAMGSDAHFASALINKGADVSHKDDKGMGILHLAAKYGADDLTIAQKVISKGANINILNNDGESPLYVACKEGNVDFAHMLLYFGADATLTSNDGTLPLVVLSSTQSQLEEILFNHVFDNNSKNTIKLPSLIKTMTTDSDLFDKIINVPTPDVTYDNNDLKYFFDHLLYLKPRRFRVFTEKFGHVVKDLIDNFPLLSMLTDLPSDVEPVKMKEILNVFLESASVEEFVQTSAPFYPTIAHLLPIFTEEDEVMRVICLMLSRGLNITSIDLDAVYSNYGHCELFKILLHMDIKMADEPKLMAAIYYDLELDLDQYAFDINILSYFNNARLKERCLSDGDMDKLRVLPTVPYLVELGRDEARKYIIKRYNVRNCMQFYTVVKWLPIGQIFKKILTFERKLYWI